MTNNAALIFNQSTNGTFASVLSCTGSVAKTSAGTLTLSAANTYSGGSTISQGGVVVADNSALGSGTVSLVDGTSLSSDGTGRTLANSMNVQGILFGGTGALTINGNMTNNRGAAITITNNVAGGLTIGNLALSHTATGRTVTFAGSGNLTLGGIISNGISGTAASALTLSGTGITALNGANTYTGVTTVSSGATVRLGNASGLGTTAAGTTVSSGGALDLNGLAVGAEAVTAAGTGVASSGAIFNS